MFASLGNKPPVPSVTKNSDGTGGRGVANGTAIKQLHTTSPGSLLRRENTPLEYLKVPRRNRSPRKDIRQSSAGRLEFSSANSLGCLCLQRRLQLACLGKRGERQPLQSERRALPRSCGAQCPWGNAEPSAAFRPRCSPGQGNQGGDALSLLLRLSGDGVSESVGKESCVHGCSAVRGL